MFTRRHYEEVARIIREEAEGDRTSTEFKFQQGRVARQFANAFSADNPRFKPDRFLKACGVE